jgi:anti-sigma-K factor RskA
MTLEQITTWTQIALSLITTIAWLKAKREAAQAQASLSIWRGVALASIAAVAIMAFKKKPNSEGGQP